MSAKGFESLEFAGDEVAQLRQTALNEVSSSRASDDLIHVSRGDLIEIAQLIHSLSSDDPTDSKTLEDAQLAIGEVLEMADFEDYERSLHDLADYEITVSSLLDPTLRWIALAPLGVLRFEAENQEKN